MDHPFLTRRRELSVVEEGLALAADLETFLSINEADAAKMRARRDPEVETLAVRQALSRRGRAGSGSCSRTWDACGSDLAAKHGSAWAALVQGV